MDDDFLGAKVGDGRVALACEMFTLDELRTDRMHNVYSIRVLFESEEADGDSADAYSQSGMKEDQRYIGTIKEPDSYHVSTQTIINIVTHPEDSVSDLKRVIQEKYEDSWGLMERRKDRDQIRTGWELICHDRRREESENSRTNSKQKRIKVTAKREDEEQSVMSYHLFVHSYRIRHGDLIHAVVRKYDSS